MSIISEALKKTQTIRSGSGEQQKNTILKNNIEKIALDIHTKIHDDPKADNENEKDTKQDLNASSLNHQMILTISLAVILLSASLFLIFRYLIFSGEPQTISSAGKNLTVSMPDTNIDLTADGASEKSPDKNIHSVPVLTGIMYSSTTPEAIVNGKIVQPGATIDGYTVNGIYEDTLILEKDSEKIVLEVE